MRRLARNQERLANGSSSGSDGRSTMPMEAASVGETANAAASNRDHQGIGDSDQTMPRTGQVSRVQRTMRRRDAQTPD